MLFNKCNSPAAGVWICEYLPLAFMCKHNRLIELHSSFVVFYFVFVLL